MRIPIILALLIVILLPRDLDGLARTMDGYVNTASASIGALFAPDDTTRVADLRE